jgi:2-polyprenyl-6-methoxyphenol hydroxylase-like FAD-dependent oxidoreductase
VLGESEPRYAGYATRRGVVESDTAKDGVMLTILGRGQRFKAYPVGKWYVYWTASTNEPPGGKEAPDVSKRTVLERFAGWPDPVETLVNTTLDDKVFFGDTYDRDPVERWGEGRVTLLGDSAHPMTWNRGQGASQGIEGAVLLAKRLAQAGDDPEAALREWEAERIPNANKVVRSARKVGRTEQAEKAPLCFMRNRMMKLVTTRPFFKFANRDQWVEF